MPPRAGGSAARCRVARRLVRAGFLLILGSASAAAAPEDALLPFMVQSACLDAAGAVVPGRLPFEPGCDRRRPLSTADALPYRKHDWPADAHAAALPRGYVASDSLRGPLLGRPAVLQLFDFGNPGTGHAFGRFDAGKGDGGQAVIFGPDGAVASPMTEDGGGGVQWLPSPDCRPAGGPTAGWLFAAPPVTETWRERVVQLFTSPAPDRCPAGFVPALTRWRLARIALPWREPGRGAPYPATPPLDAVVSEHFGGASVAAANGLERFWFVRDLGLVRWERWENRRTSTLPDLPRRIAVISGSGRCPDVALSVPPAADWVMADCRFWTNFDRAAPDRPLHAPPWPAAAGGR